MSLTLCGSGKYHTHPKEGHWKFQQGEGVSKASPEGWGHSNQKTLCGRGTVWIFSGTTHFSQQEVHEDCTMLTHVDH